MTNQSPNQLANDVKSQVPMKTNGGAEHDPAAERAKQQADLLHLAYSKAGTLRISEEQAAVLRKPFADADVDIRPDGLLYINHILVRRRLNDAFGLGRWALIPRTVKMMEHVIYVDCVLIVDGVYVGEAIGSHEYFGANSRTDYSDCVEAAKASALTRIAAKHLDVGSQCWIPSYCEAWIAKHAESYTDGKGRTLWRKKQNRTAPAQTTIVAPQLPSAPATTTTVPVAPEVKSEEKQQPDDQKSQAPLKKPTQRQWGFIYSWLRGLDFNEKAVQDEVLDGIFEVKFGRKHGDVSLADVSWLIDRIKNGGQLRIDKSGKWYMPEADEPQPAEPPNDPKITPQNIPF